ncbi:hypothetical protein YPPY90_1845, partial [Yersinia pestis PY-90]
MNVTIQSVVAGVGP